MPTYEYHCDSCDQNFDVVQSFHDDPLTSCPTCGSPVRKVFGNVGIVFKGTGFYKNDSRKKTGAKAGGEASPGKDAGSDGSGSPSESNGAAPSDASSPKSDAPSKKPAPVAPATSGAGKDSGSGSSSS